MAAEPSKVAEVSTTTKRRKETEWRVYPPKKRQREFKTGDFVLVKSKDGKTTSKGKIRNVQQQQQEQQQQTDGGATSSSTNGEKIKKKSTVSVIIKMNGSNNNEVIELNKKEQRKRILPHFLANDDDDGDNYHSSPTIFVTPETNYFRSLTCQVLETDKVLEIGCSTGETAKLLIPLCTSYVGFDTSDEMIAQCNNTLPIQKQQQQQKTDDEDDDEQEQEDNCQNKKFYCSLVKVDALVDPIKAKREANKFGSPTAIFIDIGGNRECVNVLRMVSWVIETFPASPRLIVIKSRELTQLIQSSASVSQESGLVENGNEWFRQNKQRRLIPKHPLRAPLVLSPAGDGTTPICRYYNYHKNGCSKQDHCTLDHEYCHACLEKGHVARNCPSFIGTFK